MSNEQGIPEGYKAVKSARVYRKISDGTLAITAEPEDLWTSLSEEQRPHDCDAMSCGWEHVIVTGLDPLPDWLTNGEDFDVRTSLGYFK